MKVIPLLSLLISVTPLIAENEAKPTDTPPPAEAKSLMPNQVEFLNLPQAVRKQFGKHLVEAHRLARQKRTFEALDEIEKGALVFAYSPELHLLRGTCYIELRAFDKALVEFQKAGSFTKNSTTIDCNIAEVYFCTKQWSKALAMLEKIHAVMPKTATIFGRLVEYKIMLCQRKLGNTAEVTKLTEKYDYTDDSPFYYYAQASVEFEANNRAKASEWLLMADRVFQDPNAIEPWRDALVEYGYFKGVNDQEEVKK